jgi:hypothetical protein
MALFALVKFQPPLLYLTLIFPVAVLIYGLVAEELVPVPRPDGTYPGEWDDDAEPDPAPPEADAEPDSPDLPGPQNPKTGKK